MKSLSYVLLLPTLFACGIMFISPAIHAASKRCPAGESGCTMDNAPERIRDRVNEGARRVIRDENQYGRVNEVRETVKECLTCGTDAIRDGMNKIQSR